MSDMAVSLVYQQSRERVVAQTELLCLSQGTQDAAWPFGESWSSGGPMTRCRTSVRVRLPSPLRSHEQPVRLIHQQFLLRPGLSPWLSKVLSRLSFGIRLSCEISIRCCHSARTDPYDAAIGSSSPSRWLWYVCDVDASNTLKTQSLIHHSDRS